MTDNRKKPAAEPRGRLFSRRTILSRHIGAKRVVPRKFSYRRRFLGGGKSQNLIPHRLRRRSPFPMGEGFMAVASHLTSSVTASPCHLVFASLRSAQSRRPQDVCSAPQRGRLYGGDESPPPGLAMLGHPSLHRQRKSFAQCSLFRTVSRNLPRFFRHSRRFGKFHPRVPGGGQEVECFARHFRSDRRENA